LQLVFMKQGINCWVWKNRELLLIYHKHTISQTLRLLVQFMKVNHTFYIKLVSSNVLTNKHQATRTWMNEDEACIFNLFATWKWLVSFMFGFWLLEKVPLLLLLERRSDFIKYYNSPKTKKAKES
jgi:hypothetical protein